MRVVCTKLIAVLVSVISLFDFSMRHRTKLTGLAEIILFHGRTEIRAIDILDWVSTPVELVVEVDTPLEVVLTRCRTHVYFKSVQIQLFEDIDRASLSLPVV